MKDFFFVVSAIVGIVVFIVVVVVVIFTFYGVIFGAIGFGAYAAFKLLTGLFSL